MLEIIIPYLLAIILTFMLAILIGVKIFSALVASILVGLIVYILLSPRELSDFSCDTKKSFLDVVVFLITGIILLFYIILCVINDIEIKKYHKIKKYFTKKKSRN